MMNKYKFRKYDEEYPKMFRREKIKLRKILGKEASIEHVGSTAVPGLGGKGILDIMISDNKGRILKIKKKLEKAKYIFKESGGGKDRLFFKKEYKHYGKIRMVHLQLTHYNSDEFKHMIEFKNRLIDNKGLAKEYSKVKKEAVKYAKGEGKIYRKHKEKFINENEK